MAEKTTLNPMLQMLAAVQARQSTASFSGKTVPDAAPEAATSFSQALKSASSRVNDGSATKPAETTSLPSDSPASSEPRTTGSEATSIQDASAQSTLALLTLQALAGKTSPDKPSTRHADGSPRANEVEAIPALPDAAAAAQALGLALPPAAQFAASAGTIDTAAAKPAKLAADSNTAVLTPEILPISLPVTKTNEAALDTTANADVTKPVVTPMTAPADPARSSTESSDGKGESQPDAQRGLIETASLQGRDAKQETVSTSASNSFSAELNSAQAAYGIKTEAKLETPTSQTQYTVNTPVSSRNWAEEVGARVSWIATKDNGRAELVLTPAHMGKIEISINLSGDQASASFTAANASTREALQDALPRLREILADAGIQLGQANVNAGGSGQAQAEQNAARSGSWQTPESGTGGGVMTTEELEKRLPRSNGLVDLFA